MVTCSSSSYRRRTKRSLGHWRSPGYVTWSSCTPPVRLETTRRRHRVTHKRQGELSALPGVQRINSTLVLKHVVDERPLPA